MSNIDKWAGLDSGVFVHSGLGVGMIVEQHCCMNVDLCQYIYKFPTLESTTCCNICVSQHLCKNFFLFIHLCLFHLEVSLQFSCFPFSKSIQLFWERPPW